MWNPVWKDIHILKLKEIVVNKHGALIDGDFKLVYCYLFLFVSLAVIQAIYWRWYRQSISKCFFVKSLCPGADPRGAHPAPPPPPKIGKNMIFWRKIVIFHTKHPKIVRASLRLMTRRNEKKWHFWGLQSSERGGNSFRNILKISLETYSQILIFY